MIVRVKNDSISIVPSDGLNNAKNGSNSKHILSAQSSIVCTHRVKVLLFLDFIKIKMRLKYTFQHFPKYEKQLFD